MHRLLFSLLLSSAVSFATVYSGLGSGTISAKFLSGPTIDDYSGIGTNAVSFNILGDSANIWNQIRFDPVPFQNVRPGTPFLAGYLSYTNGRYYTGDYSATLRLTTTAAPGVDPNYSQFTDLPITIRVTPDTGTPYQNADFVFFSDAQGFGSFRVIERPAGVAVTGTVQLLMSFGSFDLAGFGNVTSTPGNGFTTLSVNTLDSNFVPTDTGNGTFNGQSPSSIPEPATCGLAALALFALWSRRTRHRA